VFGVAEALCAEQTGMVERSTVVAKQLRRMAATWAADTRTDAHTKRRTGTTLLVGPDVAGSEDNQSVRNRQKRAADLVRQLHQGNRALVQAAQSLSEALIGPGVTFREKDTAFVVTSLSPKGNWFCKSQARGSAKTIERTAAEVNAALGS